MPAPTAGTVPGGGDVGPRSYPRSRAVPLKRLDESGEFVARNGSDSVTIRYTLPWPDDSAAERVTETVSVRREAEVRAGREADIRYLDDENLRFVFDR
ncbi:hypothetical protein [Streptomyces sp. NPDC088726]|uniref:hypothetical protein n=1 Tax=Streptomyces sp. NPDC088726 TaxID=3365874 RepID=UPI0037F40940